MQQLSGSNVLVFLEKNGYVFTKEPSNFKEKFTITCPEGHSTATTCNAINEAIKRGAIPCPMCRKLKRSSKLKEDIKARLEKKGYTLLSEKVEYGKKVEYICDKGHISSIDIPNLINNKGCAICAGKALTTHNQIVEVFEKEGYKVLDPEVSGSRTRFECMCPNGHVYETTYDTWYNSNKRCSECVGNKKLTQEFVAESAAEHGYTLVSEYKNTGSKVDLICPNGHLYQVVWNNFNRTGHRCPKCSLAGVSKAEKEVCDFVKEVSPFKVVENDRTILDGKELDMLIPELKLAIEYCGLFWHSELQGKDRSYHKNKLKECKAKGYKLITIFEDEWNSKRDIVTSRLKSYINSKDMVRVHARKCTIKEIEGGVAKNFCMDNHLQGYGSGATIKIGAFYKNELVSVMTFSKPSLAKGRKDSLANDYELHRFCSKLNYKIPGIASKLLAFFERNYKYSSLFSFADMRWSSGNLYEQLGFQLDYETEPNYWYFTDGLVRIHRFRLRKNKEDKPEISEWLNRVEQGYDRIWDCGNLKYVKSCKE